MRKAARRQSVAEIADILDAQLPDPHAIPFRFDKDAHDYVALDTGETLPHITGMLTRTGWVSDWFLTEEGSVRGAAVHKLTADWDLGGISDLLSLDSSYKGWVAAHVAAMRGLKPEWREVETPHVHHRYRFGGRPDRVGYMRGSPWPSRLAVVDEKSGAPAKGDPIQLALQAILVADVYHLPAELFLRANLYLRQNGRFKLELRDNPNDFHEARKIITECCR